MRSAFAVFAVSALAAGVGLTGAGLAGPEAGPRTITVSGTGEVKAVPDEASFSTGVVSEAPTAAGALSANSKAMAAVLASLKRQGVPEKSVQTSGLSLNPRYSPCKPDADCTPKITGYQVSNTVFVQTDVAKAGVVLDALVASGSNQIGGISFAIRDPKPLLAEARKAAVKDALEKAAIIAGAAGVGLGPVLSIQDNGGEAPRPMLKVSGYRAMAQEAMPIAGGEETVSAAVSVTFEIK